MSECDPCDLCCVLAVVDAGYNDLCHKLYWRCVCPNGTLSLQQEKDFVGWVDTSGFVPTEPGPQFWPWSNVYENTNGFRLKCILESGEILYSNTVLGSESGDVITARNCYCTDNGILYQTRLYVEVEIREFTRASFASSRVYSDAETYSAYLDCNDLYTVIFEWEDTQDPPVINGKFVVSATYNIDNQQGAGVRIRAGAAHYRIDAGGTNGTILLVGNLIKPWSDLIHGEKCFSECFYDLSSADTSGYPDNANVSDASDGDLIVRQTAGSSFTLYATWGLVIRYRLIEIQHVAV